MTKGREMSEAPRRGKGGTFCTQMSTPTTPQTRGTRYTLTDWQAEAMRRFGPDASAWEFICPACKKVQSPADFEAAGLTREQAANRAGQYCIGNDTDHDCDWKAFGLFRGPVFVDVEGRDVPVFDFADPS